ncbi:MAG: fumarate/nitrate reduction transcriptional regulator Fnr [Sedimenticola sp.]
MSEHKIISFGSAKISCRGCSLVSLCLPMGLDTGEVEKLDAIVKRNRPLHRGDHLFRDDEAFHSIFVVKTGSVKTYAPSEDGSEQVLGFHLPGELIGLDAIENQRHHCSAKVLETSAICEIPFHQLEILSSGIPNLQHQMYRLLSREISHDEDMLTLLGKRNAEERLAAFLLSLSDRFKGRGFSATDFFLSMSRHEIGNYLGLAVETISRLFTRFQYERLLNVERKHIQLLDTERLRMIVSSDNRQGRERSCP